MGVAVGALLALVVACAFFPAHAPAFVTPNKVGLLDFWLEQHHRDFHDDRKKLFYLATLLFGCGFGLLGAWLKPAGDRLNPFSLMLLIGFVPLANEIIRASMDNGPLEAGIYVALGLLVLTGIAAASRFLPDFADMLDRSQRPNSAAQSSAPDKVLHRAPVVALETGIALALIAALLVPTNAAAVASRIGVEMHMCSFMIGPALYEFVRGLIPGIDYYSEYSIGTPWLFHYFLDPSFEQTMINAVWFEVAEIAFFEITVFLFVWWLLRNWGWALALTVAILLTQFTTSDPLYAPSSTACRYPFMALVGICFVLWVKRGMTAATSLCLALALAGSIFMNTETGIAASAAVVVATAATAPDLVRSTGRVVLLIVLTCIAFLLLSAFAFGPGVFDIRFIEYLFEPMLLFAGGFGSVALDWGRGWPWLYNIVAPGFALASVAWAVIAAHERHSTLPRDRLAALAWVSLTALLMSAKFINMSLVSVWQLNSWAFLIVLGWWSKVLIEFVRDRQLLARPLAVRLRQVLAGSLAALLIFFLLGFSDGRSSLLAVASYRTFPSVVNRIFGVRTAPCVELRPGCSAQPIAAKDVELIRQLTRPDDRVAIFGLEDWAYLAEAKRAPKFTMLPSVTVLTHRHLDQSLRDINLIFLPRDPTDTFGIPRSEPGADVLIPQLKDHFTVIAEGADLLAWKRTR